MDNGTAPDLPARPSTTTVKTPPPATPQPNAAEINEQARMLKQYEEQQAALLAAREAEERRRQELEEQQRREFEQRQAEQAERERLAQEQLMQQQMMQYNNQAAVHVQELERELLAMRGQYERDQLMLEQYDRVGTPDYLGDVKFHEHLPVESQSAGGRTGQHLCQCERPNAVEGRFDQAAAGPSHTLAQQVRGPGQAV